MVTTATLSVSTMDCAATGAGAHNSVAKPAKI
jgi:hypothetical protein